MSKPISNNAFQSISKQDQELLDLAKEVEGWLTTLNRISAQIHSNSPIMSNFESLPFQEPIRRQRDKKPTDC